LICKSKRESQNVFDIKMKNFQKTVDMENFLC